MNFELFDKAVDFIASRSDSQLNLGNWQYNSAQKSDDLMWPHIAKSSEEVTCGTIACAAGWLALSADFNALGLYPNPAGCPIFKGSSAYHAMRVLFDITHNDAKELFAFRSGSDSVTFGRDISNQMTDRQLWLSRARSIRAKYVAIIENPNKFRSKPVEVEAYTFEEIIAAGKKSATSMVDGVPWSFAFRNCLVTHENDNLYLISTVNGSHYLYRDMVYVTGPNIDQVVSKEHFEANYERA